MAILIDTSVLLAFALAKDKNHMQASQIIRAASSEVRIVAAPVISELFYIITTRLSYRHGVQIFGTTRAAFQIKELNASDMARMQQIMIQYEDAMFDFADVAIMALSEHLNITRVCTFDRRDFSIFRPSHCDYVELLP